MKTCLFCGSKLLAYNVLYCSNQCQADKKYTDYINKWKSGDETGTRGSSTRNFSRHLVRYLHQKYGNTCARCGWNAISPYTKRAPLEIDHIDGNADNNIESNLILLCPNCHSLTASYRNLNKGRGRLWRREKYVKIV